MDRENPTVNFKKTDLATQIAYQFTEEIRGDSARYQSENVEFGKKINKIMGFINLERNK